MGNCLIVRKPKEITIIQDRTEYWAVSWYDGKQTISKTYTLDKGSYLCVISGAYQGGAHVTVLSQLSVSGIGIVEQNQLTNNGHECTVGWSEWATTSQFILYFKISQQSSITITQVLSTKDTGQTPEYPSGNAYKNQIITLLKY